MDISKIKESYTENKLVFHCGLLAILFLINCFIPNFSYFVWIVLAGLIIYDDRVRGFSEIVFCIPFCCIDGGVGAICFFGCLLVYLIKNYIIFFFFDKKRMGLSCVISFGLMLIYSFLPIGDYSWQKFTKILIVFVIILTFYLFISYKNTFNLKFNLSVLALALFISAVFFLTYFISPYMRNRTIWNVGEKFIRLTVLQTNPNTIAMICEVSLGFLTYYILKDKFEWTDIITYIIFAMFGIATFSKTFLILFSILILILLVKLTCMFKRKMIWIICVLCALILLAFIFKGDFLTSYLGRFVSEDMFEMGFDGIMNVVTTNRFDLWLDTIEYLLLNPIILIFGAGFGAPLLSSLSAHCFYISLIYELGIVGTGVIIVVIVCMIFEFKKIYKQTISPAVIVPLVIIGLLMLVEDLFLYIY